MKASERGIKLIQSFESCKLTAYEDVIGVWTIGWGNTYYENGKPVKKGDKITQEKADLLFKNVLATFEDRVSKLITSNINQNQFDALVSFAYNNGIGNLKASTLLKKVNFNPNDPEIANQFSRWINSGGKPFKGLIRRRKEESELYFTKPETNV